MSNLSKLLKFENFNTEHLSVAVDMNSGWNNPEGMTFKHAIVGSITMLVLLGLALGILWLIAVIVNKFR